jgi:hypothetical protein
MAKNKKHHDQEVLSSHEGFREGTRKYTYSFAYRGKIKSRSTNDEELFVEGQVIDGKVIRKIEQKWSYGTLCTLIFLED